MARVTAEELKPAAVLCNYIIYSFVGLENEKYKIKSLDEDLDTEKGKNNFRAVTNLKIINPQLKVLVSVGGFWDEDEPEKYLKSVRKTLIDGNVRVRYVIEIFILFHKDVRRNLFVFILFKASRILYL